MLARTTMFKTLTSAAAANAPRRSIVTLAEKVYTATATSTGSRAKGLAETQDKTISLTLALPKEMGGKGPQAGSNPEQLFGLAWSACFLSALGATHGNLHPNAKPLGKDLAVRAHIAVGKPKDLPGFGLAATIEVPKGPLVAAGLDDAAQAKLVEEAHKVCPYSRAVKDNIEVKVSVVDA